MAKKKTKIRPFKIQSSAEKMDNQLNNFIDEIVARIGMLEAYCFNLGNDLSVVITAMKTLKSLMKRKKMITDKQFDKEFEKLYNEMLAVIKQSEKEAMESIPNMSRDEIVKLMNDPDMGHA